MTFNAGVPTANQTISSTQSPIQTNFSLIGTAMAPAGIFNRYAFQNVTAPSAPVNPVSVLYTANDGAGNPQLKYRNSLSDIFVTGPSSFASPSGYIILPGGLILQWMQVTILNGAGSGSANFPINFPNAVFSLQATTKSTSSFGAQDYTLEGSSINFGPPSNVTLNRTSTSGNLVVWVWGIGN